MSERNSSMACRKFRIPGDKWELFCADAEKAARWLPGSCVVDREREIVRVDYHDSETLGFARDMEKCFPGSPYYIIHKTDWNDFYFAEAIAAYFMLFRQDCLDEDPKCDFIGHFGHAQEGLDSLREAGVWRDTARPCLLCKEELAPGAREAAPAIKQAFADAWRETAIPDRERVNLAIKNAIEAARPEAVSRQNDIDAWEPFMRSFCGLGRFASFPAVFIRRNGETSKNWFMDGAEAGRFIADNAADLPQVWKIPADGSDYVFRTSVDLENLPREHPEAAPKQQKRMRMR